MQNEELRKANIGEWSELYVLFKIFEERTILAANADLRPVKDMKYRFLKVFREEVLGKEYEYNLEDDNKVNILDENGELIKVIDTQNLSEKTQKIFRALKDANSSSFSMQDISDLMVEYLIHKVKSNSTQKTDLLAVIDDKANVTGEKMGFSIKSHVGGAPTLVNSSGHTNFIYEVTDFNGDINEINKIEGRSKVRDRLEAIYRSGAELNFVRMSSSVFNSNLRFADTQFPNLMARMLLDYFCGKGNKLAVLSKIIAEYDNLDITEEEVIFKLQVFLRSAALGMVPSKPWDTKLSSYGGYIVVLNNGSLICYNLLKDDEFKDYLFNNTKFDTPSTTKYNYGHLYTEDGKLMMNLNLQIRFLK